MADKGSEENEKPKFFPKAETEAIEGETATLPDNLDNLSEDEMRRRLKTYIPQKGSHASKFILGLKGGKEVIEKDSVDKKTTVFIAGCLDSEITVDTMVTKILVQGCRNVVVRVNGPVLTNTVEVWSCEDTTLEVNEVLIATLQVDMCKQFKARYSRKKLFHKMIWACLSDYTLTFGDDADYTYTNSFDEMVPKYPTIELRRDISQFIDSLEDGKIRTERLLRLNNGFPTTEREQEEFDKNSEKNRKLAEEHYRGLVDKVAGDEELKKLGIKTIKKGDQEVKKLAKPNDPCPCASGKKYKKCCGNPAAASSKKEEE